MFSSFIPAWFLLRSTTEQAALANNTEAAAQILSEAPDYCYYDSRRTLEEIRDAENSANPHGFYRAFRFEYE
jgi:hypothetical protein